jgi:hypothetical protein
VSAQLADTYGNAVTTNGFTVTWSSNKAGSFTGGSSSTTNASGIASKVFNQSDIVGTVHTITASANSGAITGNATVTVVAGKVWTGNSGNGFNSNGSWQDNTPPGTDESIYFADNPTNPLTMDADRSVTDININGSSANHKVVLNGKKLTIKGNITLGGSAKIQANAANDEVEMAGSSAQTIPANAFVDNEVRSLKINNASGVTLGGTTIVRGALTPSTGTLTTGGHLLLRSDVNGTARVAQVQSGAAISGLVTWERYLPLGRKWRMLTVPMTGTTNNSIFYNFQNNDQVIAGKGVEIWGPTGSTTPGSDNNGLALGPHYSMRTYTASGWTDVTNTNTSVLFDGTTNYAYSLFAAGPYRNGLSTIAVSQPGEVTTLTATGNLITGDHTKNLTANSAGQFFLIGNPYASPYDPNAFTSSGTINRTNLDPFLWIWDSKPGFGTGNGLGRYVSFDIDNHRYNITGNGIADNNVQIQSGQAFFVRASASGPATLIFREASKGAADSHSMLGDGLQTSNPLIAVTLTTPSGDSSLNTDGAVAFFYQGGNAEVDNKDGMKLMNGTENLFFRRSGRNLTFEHRPIVGAKDTLYLRTTNMQKQSYGMTVEGENFTDASLQALLVDRYTGKETTIDMKGITRYSFEVNADSLSSGDRFMVVFSKAASPITVTPEPSDNGRNLIIYPNPVKDRLKVHVKSDDRGGYGLKILNMNGSLILQRSGLNGQSGTIEVNTSAIAKGVYQLVVTNAAGQSMVETFVKE